MQIILFVDPEYVQYLQEAADENLFNIGFFTEESDIVTRCLKKQTLSGIKYDSVPLGKVAVISFEKEKKEYSQIFYSAKAKKVEADLGKEGKI